MTTTQYAYTIPAVGASPYAPNINAALQAVDDLAPWIDVRSRGADPTGSTAANTAFTDTLAACVGTNDPVTTTRSATHIFYMGEGSYRLTASIPFLSTIGLTVRGAGPSATTIQADGTFGDRTTASTAAGTAVLDFCGMAHGTIERFTISGSSHTPTCFNALQLYGDTARAARTTSGVAIRQVHVQNMTLCVNGLAIGTNDGTTATDNIEVEAVRVISGSLFGAATLSGALNSSDTSFTVTDTFSWVSRLPTSDVVVKIGTERILVGARSGTSFSSCTRGYNSTTAASHSANDNVDRADYSQKGIALGGIAYGNKYIYNFKGYVSLGFRYGVYVSQTETTLTSGNLGSNGTDFFHSSQNYFSVRGVESQASRMMFETNAAVSTAGSGHFSDYSFNQPKLAVNNVIGRWDRAGSLTLERINAWNGVGTSATIVCVPNTPLGVKTSGCIFQAAAASVMPLVTNLNVKHENIAVVNSSGQVQSSVADMRNGVGYYAGTGAPSSGLGSNGDFYDRSDGTVAASTVRYHKESGSWVAFTTT